MLENLIKKGRLMVPLFILFISVTGLKAKMRCSFFPSMISVISSFEGDDVFNYALLARIAYLKSFSKIGRGESALALLSLHTITSLISDKSLKFEKKVFFTIIMSGVTAVSLKYIFHRTRPNTGLNDFYGPSLAHTNISFPSGHTLMAFAMAGAMSERYGHPGIFYALSTLVGIARIAKGMHYLSDVVTGAYAGYFISKLSFDRTPCPRLYVLGSRKEVSFIYIIK